MTRRRAGRSLRRWVAALALLALAAALILTWRFTPLGDALSPRRIADRLDVIETSSWAPLYFIAAFLIGGLVMFPVTVLSAATAIVFPPWKAAPISLTGILLSAALLHWIGARFLRKPGRDLLGRTLRKLREALHDHSIVTIATLRMTPIAPFSLVNLAAGAVGVRLSDYMLGSALGLAPGLTMMCLFGRQVRAFWKDPSAWAVFIAAGITLAWIALSLLLQRWIAQRKCAGARASRA
jgi:phospholipase D1/2